MDKRYNMPAEHRILYNSTVNGQTVQYASSLYTYRLTIVIPHKYSACSGPPKGSSDHVV